MSTKCPDCGNHMEYINSVPVCPVCDEPMNKTMEDDKWVQGDNNGCSRNETSSSKAC